MNQSSRLSACSAPYHGLPSLPALQPAKTLARPPRPQPDVLTIEVATQGGLAEGLRSRLRFDRLSLADTWLESLERGVERLSYPLYGEVDTRSWEPSWDLFGGGGLVSSTQDLVRFMDALFAGQVFASPATLGLMLEVPAVAAGALHDMNGAMGINRFEVGGVTCNGGFGFFGTEVIHRPTLDLTFARCRLRRRSRDCCGRQTLHSMTSRRG